MGNYRHAPGTNVLESQVEQRLDVMVRRVLRGKTIKLAPVEAGAPDRLVLLPGGTVRFVELKADKGQTSAIQDIWHKRARRLGVDVAVLHGIDEVENWVGDVYTELFRGNAR